MLALFAAFALMIAGIPLFTQVLKPSDGEPEYGTLAAGMTHTPPKQPKRLLLFSMTRLDEMLLKGNIGYLRHYERYFDEVHVVYLYGYAPAPVRFGATTLLSVGTRFHALDLVLAPLRLLRIARAIRPSAYLTADQVFSCWTASLLRLVLGARIVLLPVAHPDEIYQSTGHSLSGLPIAIERFLIGVSYRAAAKVVTTEQAATYVEWLRNYRHSKRKLQVVPCVVEEFPPLELIEGLLRTAQKRGALHDPPRLLYVGRLHPEKLTLGLIDLAAAMQQRGIAARLVVAGDGIEMAPMQDRARQLAVADQIEWLGFVPAERLAEVYGEADVFISTVTGTALREAGLAGLPVAAYEVDWVKGLLQHELSALLVPVGDVEALADCIARLLNDNALRIRVAGNFHALAKKQWSPDRIGQSLAETFG
jgi:glycosyltransferase involved in cell wall biosynthesis